MSSSSPESAASAQASAPTASPPSSLSFDPREFEMVDVQPSEVEFLQTLKEKRTAENKGDQLIVTYKVRVREKDCVLKVFKGNESFHQYWAEYQAYLMLDSNGFCKRGDAYGSFTTMRNPPSAILIEFIPNAARIELKNFSQPNIDKLCQILREFHDIGLLHGDPYPRNMMVVQGPPDRVFWLDFDSSQIVDREKLDDRTEHFFAEEAEMMDFFAKGLAKDAENGKLEEVWACYYE
ncbi:hypothetical protein NQ176_g4159 [Zarea fungicola]|uniref:Uncharacterized protein n=1 Tax=Zarea fungicola TaxID=93591 RepID=A0ACC1NG51_9HYPO|nr:hypothetical protein NQ176_g4159 [Lecanicillium fungicola]